MKKAIVDLIAGDTQLKSKRELIEKFINENLPHISDSDDIPDEFESFWTEEKENAIRALSIEEGLDFEKLEEVLGEYLFSEQKPLRDDVIGMLNQRPALKERGKIAERIISKILSFVETYINGVGGN